MGLIGDGNEVLFEFRLARRFIISSVASSFSCSLISLYIWSILWNINHASRVSLCLALLLLILDTFTNTVFLFFLLLSWPYYLQLTFLITNRLYLDDELAVIYLVDCCTLTAFMTSCSSAPNVLISIGNLWEPSISTDATTNGIVPTQDVQFFYTRSHLSAPQKFALLFSIYF